MDNRFDYDPSLFRSISAPRLREVLLNDHNDNEIDLKTPSPSPREISPTPPPRTPFLSSGVWSYSSHSLGSEWNSMTSLPRTHSNPQQTQAQAWIHAKPFQPTQKAQGHPSSFAEVTSKDEVEIFLANHYVNAQVDSLLLKLQPNPESEAKRNAVVSFVESLIKKNLGAKIFTHGSFALKTYLPDSDLDLAAFFTHNHLRTWVQRTLKSLLRDEDLSLPLSVRGATFSESPKLAKLVQASVSGISIELCANQTHVLAATTLFEEFDQLLGRDHLFKRTLLLVKAWGKYEAQILGKGQGLLSGYCIRSMLLFIFNAFSAEIDTPLQGLWKLLEYLSNFQWDKYAFTVYGPVFLSELPQQMVYETRGPCAWPTGTEPVISRQLLAKYDSFAVPQSDSSEETLVFEKSYLNLIDPRDSCNNLGGRFCRQRAGVIRNAFGSCAKSFRQLISEWTKSRSHSQSVRSIFYNTFQKVSDVSCELGFDGSAFLDGNLAMMKRNLMNASEFDVPDYSEEELVELVGQVLEENEGAVTVGKMGSLLHAATNNHSLPAMLKAKYGGLKKLLRRHPDVFYIADDHPHNPRVYLRESQLEHLPTTLSLSHSSPQLHTPVSPQPQKSNDIPRQFKCPLTHRMMEEPVVACDGFSYERRALERWILDSGHISPVTGQTVDLSILFPNNVLRELIRDFNNE